LQHDKIWGTIPPLQILGGTCPRPPPRDLRPWVLVRTELEHKYCFITCWLQQEQIDRCKLMRIFLAEISKPYRHTLDLIL